MSSRGSCGEAAVAEGEEGDAGEAAVPPGARRGDGDDEGSTANRFQATAGFLGDRRRRIAARQASDAAGTCRTERRRRGEGKMDELGFQGAGVR